MPDCLYATGTDPKLSSSPHPGRRQLLRLGVAFILFFLTACQIPTEDISTRQRLSASSIKNAIETAFVCLDVKMLDSVYIAYTRSELVACLEAGKWIGELQYISEVHDCEEFVFDTVAWVRGVLHGIPFGFGLRDTATCHAENLFVDDSLNVWIVDLRRHGSELIAPSHAFFYFLVLI